MIFDYDGRNISSELDYPSGVTVARYVFGPSAGSGGDDAPLVWYNGAGTNDRRWLIPDERGSIVAVTDAGGAVIRVNTYDEFGIPGATNLGRFQYTGQAWLPEIGMYNYKARMYSPTLGRFLQTDPIGYADGVNWYNYVGSDPVNRRDPSGLLPCPINICTYRADPPPSGGSSISADDIVVTGTRPPLDPFAGQSEFIRTLDIASLLERSIAGLGGDSGGGLDNGNATQPRPQQPASARDKNRADERRQKSCKVNAKAKNSGEILMGAAGTAEVVSGELGDRKVMKTPSGVKTFIRVTFLLGALLYFSAIISNSIDGCD